MNQAKRRINVIKKTVKNAFTFGKKVDVTRYAVYTKKIVDGEHEKIIWTNAFVAALKDNEHVYIPEGLYYIDETVVIPSNRKITAHKKAEIRLLGGVNVVMFRNEDVIDGSGRIISKDEPKSENISISGGLWSTEFKKRAVYGTNGVIDECDSMHGVYTTMLFSGVKNLSLKNMSFKNTAAFAVQIGRAENAIIENIAFDNCFADGVHINGDVKNIAVSNITGNTEDDLIALNAYDWDNSTINNGSMQNVTVYNVTAKGGSYHAMRLQSGITSDALGNIDCFMKDIYLSRIVGVDGYKMYLQTPPYSDIPDGTKVGKMDDIVIENLKIVKNRSTDGTYNYRNGDPITGHFGVFELGSNINNLTLKNIDVKLNVKDYPETAHFITVGPKSCFLKDEKIEIFDPYVTCKIQNIYYRNIKINGKKVDNLRDYVKEISFSNLYETKNAFGNGTVNNITEI